MKCLHYLWLRMHIYFLVKVKNRIYNEKRE